MAKSLNKLKEEFEDTIKELTKSMKTSSKLLKKYRNLKDSILVKMDENLVYEEGWEGPYDTFDDYIECETRDICRYMDDMGWSSSSLNC